MKKRAKKNTSNTNKSIISEIKEEFKRHMGTLMEQVHKEVKTVGEGHSSLSGKIDKIGSEVEIVKSELGIVKSEVGIVKSEVGSVKSELKSVKMAVMDTSQTVKSIEKKLDNHGTRIIKLEEKVHA